MLGDSLVFSGAELCFSRNSKELSVRLNKYWRHLLIFPLGYQQRGPYTIQTIDYNFRFFKYQFSVVAHWRRFCESSEQGLERYLRYQAPHIRPPISNPPYQAPHIRPPYLAPHIKPPNASPLQYQDPISGHPFQYETADLPYEAPTYNIKPLVLDVQNEPPTYDIKLFELNRQHRKYQNRQPTNQATINDIRPIVLEFQNEALTYDIKLISEKYEIADLPYWTATYDIKPLVLDFRNEALTYDIKPIGEKYEIADQPDQAPAYDINSLTLVCQYTASNCNISDPNYSYNCQ